MLLVRLWWEECASEREGGREGTRMEKEEEALWWEDPLPWPFPPAPAVVGVLELACGDEEEEEQAADAVAASPGVLASCVFGGV